MNRIAAVNRVFLATVIISIIGSFVNGFVELFTDNYFVLLLVSQVLLVAPSIIYFIYYRINIKEAIRFRKISGSSILWIILFAFLIQPLMNFINAISLVFVENTTSDIMFNIVQNNIFILSLFMIAFVPCVFEETVYRGVFYNEYSKVNTIKGILLSGFLFGIIHGNLNQFSYAFAMGIVFALLIEATDSIIATMIVHFVINGTSVVMLYAYPKLFQLLEQIYGKSQFNAEDMLNELRNSASLPLDISYAIQTYGITALFATILAFITFRKIAMKNGRWEFIKGIFHKNEPWKENSQNTVNIQGDYEADSMEYQDFSTTDPGKRRLMTFSLAAGIFICVALLILNEVFAARNSIQPMEDGKTLAVYLQMLNAFIN